MTTTRLDTKLTVNRATISICHRALAAFAHNEREIDRELDIILDIWEEDSQAIERELNAGGDRGDCQPDNGV